MRYFGILVAAGKMVQTEFRSQPLSRCSRGRWKNGDRRRSFRSEGVSWSPREIGVRKFEVAEFRGVPLSLLDRLGKLAYTPNCLRSV